MYDDDIDEITDVDFLEECREELDKYLSLEPILLYLMIELKN